MRLALLTVLVWAIGVGAQAGPWLREKGDVFLSFGQNLALTDGAHLPVHVDPNLYAEWGMSERMTLAFSAFSGDAGREKTVEIWGIRALPLPKDSPHRMTVSFGMAARQIDGQPGTEPLMMAGVSWGRGIQDGWLTTEAQVAFRPESDRMEGKVDFTWGRRLGDRWTGYFMVTAGEGHTGDFYAKVSPNAILEVSDKVRLSMGLTQALTGDLGTGLTLSAWLDF